MPCIGPRARARVRDRAQTAQPAPSATFHGAKPSGPDGPCPAFEGKGRPEKEEIREFSPRPSRMKRLNTSDQDFEPIAALLDEARDHEPRRCRGHRHHQRRASPWRRRADRLHHALRSLDARRCRRAARDACRSRLRTCPSALTSAALDLAATRIERFHRAQLPQRSCGSTTPTASPWACAGRRSTPWASTCPAARRPTPPRC